MLMKPNEIISCLNEKIKIITLTDNESWLLNPIYSAIDEIRIKNKALEMACEELAVKHNTNKREAEKMLIENAKRSLNM